MFGGEYHSTFKGRGMTFSEVRQYQFGDDVRSIDWNVTARYNEPFVKIFEEERELTLMLVVDVSGSETFGTKTQLKREILTEIAATLSFSALQNNDKVGLLLFSDQVELFIPPKKGRSHILRIIRELLEFEPKSKRTNLATALEFLLSVLKKKAIVFMLSDFMDEGYEKTLRIASKKHDLTGIRVYDPLEAVLPKLGIVSMRDSETQSEFWADMSSIKHREILSKNIKEKWTDFEIMCISNQFDVINVKTNRDYVEPLMNYFNKREKRI